MRKVIVGLMLCVVLSATAWANDISDKDKLTFRVILLEAKLREAQMSLIAQKAIIDALRQDVTKAQQQQLADLEKSIGCKIDLSAPTLTCVKK